MNSFWSFARFVYLTSMFWLCSFKGSWKMSRVTKNARIDVFQRSEISKAKKNQKQEVGWISIIQFLIAGFWVAIRFTQYDSGIPLNYSKACELKCEKLLKNLEKFLRTKWSIFVVILRFFVVVLTTVDDSSFFNHQTFNFFKWKFKM